MSLLVEWIGDYKVLVWWLSAVSLLMFIGSLVTIPIILIKIPSNYFRFHLISGHTHCHRQSFFRFLYLILKNTIGVIFVLAGLIMLVLPGQGILTIIVGMSLLNVPGKQQVVMRIIRNKTVFKAINSLRRKADRPPIVIPD